MKALATSLYCPNDCDRKVQEEIDPEKTPRLINWRTDFVGPPESSSQTADASDPDLDWSWIDTMVLDTD